MRTRCAAARVPASASDGAGHGVAAHVRVAVLGQVRGEVGDVRAHLGDRERDRRRALERDAERRVPHLGLEQLGQPKGRERALVRLGVGLARAARSASRRVSAWAVAPRASGQPSRELRAHIAVSPAPSATAIAAADPPAGRGHLRGDVAEHVAERRGEHVVRRRPRDGLSSLGAAERYSAARRRRRASTSCGSGS